MKQVLLYVLQGHPIGLEASQNFCHYLPLTCEICFQISMSVIGITLVEVQERLEVFRQPGKLSTNVAVSKVQP